MDVEELSMIGPVVDLANVDAIHRKRLLAFVNHFLIRSANFLNRLAHACEGKLLHLDLKLQKLECSLILLESKLSSIPGLDNVASLLAEPSNPSIEQNTTKDTSMLEEICPATVNEMELDSKAMEVKDSETEETDSALVKYVKMIQVGVPLTAVKLKMTQEGVPIEKQKLVTGE